MKSERDIEIQIAMLELERARAKKEELKLISAKIEALEWVLGKE